MSLSEDKLAKYREVLLESREKLLGCVNGLTKTAEQDGQNTDTSRRQSDDDADSASDNYEQGFTFLTLESEEALLNKVEEALVRIQDKSYGICLDCEVEISEDRLEALPFADRCIQCQTKADEEGINPDDSGDFELLDEGGLEAREEE